MNYSYLFLLIFPFTLIYGMSKEEAYYKYLLEREKEHQNQVERELEGKMYILSPGLKKTYQMRTINSYYDKTSPIIFTPGQAIFYPIYNTAEPGLYIITSGALGPIGTKYLVVKFTPEQSLHLVGTVTIDKYIDNRYLTFKNNHIDKPSESKSVIEFGIDYGD